MAQELKLHKILKEVCFAEKIASGDVLHTNVFFKSPGIGLHPKFIDAIVGEKVKYGVESDTPVSWEDLE